MYTSAQTVSETHPLLCASEQMFQDSQMYSLGISPICITEVENALLYYLSTKIANALIRGLKFGVKLHYSGSHMPFKAKHLKVCLKILTWCDKELTKR